MLRRKAWMGTSDGMMARSAVLVAKISRNIDDIAIKWGLFGKFKI